MKRDPVLTFEEGKCGGGFQPTTRLLFCSASRVSCLGAGTLPLLLLLSAAAEAEAALASLLSSSDISRSVQEAYCGRLRLAEEELFLALKYVLPPFFLAAFVVGSSNWRRRKRNS